MKQENIFKAITSAIAYLEDSMEALVKKDEKKVAHFAWRAASDLEYALFLFSLMHQDETESPSWKLNPKSKQLEIEPLLISAQDLLKEAKNRFEADELHEAHKKTWIARGQLLKVHDLLEKKLKKDEKTSS
ncbi:MAG: hypothetical protein OEY47_03110 [Candidatus Bathyarchaeota archaeon]|nr:hypothetical protein [Candidatus Bathyarchaeota archaeon]MDH5635637.1 hypothetical protein [Candidatus Bathyarchaeota archaeon]MDH5701802.1 hypothetical protein [Candidatus Bathyarchaeota archaeon]